MDDRQKQTLLQFFKAVGQDARLKIVGLLANRPYTVLELADALDMKETAVSNHLHRLKKAGLVAEKPQTPVNLYHLNTNMLAEWQSVLLVDTAAGAAVEE